VPTLRRIANSSVCSSRIERIKQGNLHHLNNNNNNNNNNNSNNHNNEIAGFEVLTEVTMKSSAFWGYNAV
jgi:hypothetical protein